MVKVSELMLSMSGSILLFSLQNDVAVFLLRHGCSDIVAIDESLQDREIGMWNMNGLLPDSAMPIHLDRTLMKITR